MILDFENLDVDRRYKVISNTAFPRPIAWITTEANGIVNLAPFSYFAPLSSEPPCVVVSVGHRDDGTQKDTLANILKQRECTINLAHYSHKEPLKKSAEPLSPRESEVERFGIDVELVEEGFPPIVKGVKAAFFCRYLQTVELESPTVPLILQIEKVYIQDGCIDERLNITLENLGRVGKEFLTDFKREA